MVSRIFDLLPYYQQKFNPKVDALAGKVNGEWIKYSIDQYREAVDAISCALIGLGIKPGDKVATIAVSMPEWNFVDMAVLQIGAVHVPVYPTISESDYRYILEHSDVRLIFVSGSDMYRKIRNILPELTKVEGVYTFRDGEPIKHLSELIAMGKTNGCSEELEKRKEAVKPTDVATLIYTSGTTGNPKGVMLTHNNLLSNVLSVHHIFPVDQTCRAVSYLPLCHVYERMNIYTYHYLGVSIYYAENMGTIADNIREVGPEILTTVPRLLEKVFDKIMSRGAKLKGFKRWMFDRAVTLGMQYDPFGGNNIFYRIQLALFNHLVFGKWREALGGRMRVIVSGGAALQPRLVRIFSAAGIPVLEGYGLTETSPVIAVNTLQSGGMLPGTVGKVLRDVLVKISDEDEILVKGPNVMVGYYKAPALTAEVIDAEGWFHTGDKGVLEPTGHLRITGRIKEIFKSSMGKYISPALIENKFKESPFIDGIIVLGENQKFAAALIVPDFECLRTWCRSKGIDYTHDSEMIQHSEIRRRIKKEVDALNKQFGDYEQVKRFDLIDHEWSVQTGELTANLKLKRSFIMEKYASKIDALFT